MFFRFSQLTTSKSMAAFFETGHFDMPSYRNGGPVKHIDASSSVTVQPRETISAGMLWVVTSLKLAADVKLWISETRFPTKVESVTECCWSQWSTNCEFNQR